MRVEPKIVFNAIVACTAMGVGSVALLAIAVTSSDRVIQVACGVCSPVCFLVTCVGVTCLQEYLATCEFPDYD